MGKRVCIVIGTVEGRQEDKFSRARERRNRQRVQKAKRLLRELICYGLVLAVLGFMALGIFVFSLGITDRVDMSVFIAVWISFLSAGYLAEALLSKAGLGE